MPTPKYSETSKIYYKLDEASGTVANDSSPSGLDGTVVGTTIVAGQWGNARSIVADNTDYIYKDSALASNANITLMGWFKPDPASRNTSATYNNFLANITTKSATGMALGLSLDGYYSLNYYDSAIGHIASKSTILATSDWVHLAYTKSGSTYKLFINGVLSHTLSFSGDIGLHFYSCYVNGISYLQILNSQIDEVILWESTLTDTQVKEVYDSYFLISKYLFEDGTDIKKWDTSLATPAWVVVGTSPVTKAMFDTYGMDGISNISDSQIKSLVSSTPKLLFWTTDTVSKQTKMTAVPPPKLMKANGDILLGSMTSLDSVNLTANVAGNGAIRAIVSFDKGTNWKAWDESLATPSWITVDSTNLTEVKSKGMTTTNINSRTKADWDLLFSGSATMRFGYYMEILSSTDNASADAISITADFKGAWQSGIHGTDYTYGYPSNDILRINILGDGDYKINY
jgi:hypothetical protein